MVDLSCCRIWFILEVMKGRVYIIQCVINDLYNEKVYIGSTVSALGARLAKHRYEASHRHENKCPLAEYMRKHGTDAFIISLIREVDFQTRIELLQEEEKEIEKWPAFALLNIKPAHTETPWESRFARRFKERKKEYSIEHKEEIAIYQRAFRVRNKESLKEYHRIYYQKRKRDTLE